MFIFFPFEKFSLLSFGLGSKGGGGAGACDCFSGFFLFLYLLFLRSAILAGRRWVAAAGGAFLGLVFFFFGKKPKKTHVSLCRPSLPRA
jgi:hypothetical protein